MEEECYQIPNRRDWCRQRRAESWPFRLPSGDVHQPLPLGKQSKAIHVISICVTPSFRINATTRIFLSYWECLRCPARRNDGILKAVVRWITTFATVLPP